MHASNAKEQFLPDRGNEGHIGQSKCKGELLLEIDQPDYSNRLSYIFIYI